MFSLSSELLVTMSKKKAIAAFHRAAKTVPFYHSFLKNNSVSSSKIKTISDFEKLPILNKENFFAENISTITDIARHGSLHNCASILPSSGFSGVFSFGLISKHEARNANKRIDTTLDYIFHIRKKKTLIINALSMGINIPSNLAVTINIGPRQDIALSTVRIFSKEFQQTIIVGDNSWIKNLLEAGINQGINWNSIGLRIIIGGESFPESFRSYLAQITNISLDSKTRQVLIGTSFGIAEIGLNVLFETQETIALRRKLTADTNLMPPLFGEQTILCPMLFQYNPMNYYIEELDGQLLFTVLSQETMMPLIRYASGDIGQIIPYESLKKYLFKLNLKEYIPSLPLPIIALKGRKQILDFTGITVSPDTIKHIIYTSKCIQPLITGYFRMAKLNNKLQIEFQLKEDKNLPRDCETKFLNELVEFLSLPVETELIFYPYRKFPYALELDYERKFKYA